MRLFKTGSLSKPGRLGIKAIEAHSIKPLEQLAEAVKTFFFYKRQGVIRFIRLPGVRFAIVFNKRGCV